MSHRWNSLFSNRLPCWRTFLIDRWFVFLNRGRGVARRRSVFLSS